MAAQHGLGKRVKLSPDAATKLATMVRAIGRHKTARKLGTTDITIINAEHGGTLQKRTRDRLEALIQACAFSPHHAG